MRSGSLASKNPNSFPADLRQFVNDGTWVFAKTYAESKKSLGSDSSTVRNYGWSSRYVISLGSPSQIAGLFERSSSLRELTQSRKERRRRDQ
jgi:hypothetical protein